MLSGSGLVRLSAVVKIAILSPTPRVPPPNAVVALYYSYNSSMVKFSDIILQEDMRRRLRKAITSTYDIHLTFDDVQSGRRKLSPDSDARQLSTPYKVLEEYSDLPIMFLEGICVSVYSFDYLSLDMREAYKVINEHGLLSDVLRAGFSSTPSYEVGEFLRGGN